jgi:Fusaric acid resistance protein-like
MSARLVKWSPDAGLRALRATIVVPTMLAVTFVVLGNGQMALFAVFGSFATLVMTTFAGTRRDKAVAHLGLAVVGSVAIVIGTAVSGVIWLAALVTVPVAFAIFLGGVAGPNAYAGVTGALLAYVLPVASPGGIAALPSRLEGWWLASVVSTAAVLLISRRPAGYGLRAATADCASALATYLSAAARGGATDPGRDAVVAAKIKMREVFVASPYRPTGLTTADQALGSVVHLLEWCASLACDYLKGHAQATGSADAALADASASVLAEVATLLSGHDPAPGTEPVPHMAELLSARQSSIEELERLTGDHASVHAYASNAVHVQSIAIVVRSVAADALIAARCADPESIAEERLRWYGDAGSGAGAVRSAIRTAVHGAASHVSPRSVAFRNSLRGAVALAIAVALADMLNVQHGFWVVLGTLSVLRTNAASTGSTAVRALAGTCLGFAIGAALLLGIGTGTAALWAALPVAVLVAAYSPGTAPFAFGQAGFTVTVLVLFNLLVPVGWKVGLLRVEDVALGCAVSLVVGLLFWPHGASAVVGDDLAETFRRGGAYLTQAVDWALGLRAVAPDVGVASIGAAIRLDDAIRGFLAEQGAKRLKSEDLWTLVTAATRLRLTAYSVASLPGRGAPEQPGGHRAGGATPAMLSADAGALAGFYERIAEEVGRPDGTQPSLVALPERGEPAEITAGHVDSRIVWVSDHLRHLSDHADAITEPAERVAEMRRLPWWR